MNTTNEYTITVYLSPSDIAAARHHAAAMNADLRRHERAHTADHDWTTSSALRSFLTCGAHAYRARMEASAVQE